MTRDEAETALVRMGVPEETAVLVIEALEAFGPYEVKLKVAERTYVSVSCLFQGKFAILPGNGGA